ncbi:MAG TPA: protein phosphatase 2C domain-containing protein [Candidatus Omnitrophota bacterium]|nr:protein phosphatase 2C domain-containing protein [Candidatus Omnitrophota bacterium]
MKGIKIYADNPLRFDFIIDTGESNLKDEALRLEADKLVKYFLASLTVPKEDLWVNLSPYEKDRIVPEGFGITEMGRDLLAQDYLLKQLTASLIYPEEELGKKFWDRIHQRAYELYGTSDIPVNTFNKVWIVPEKAVVYENGDTAFVVESHLKVMLEEDYLALSQSSDISHQTSEEGLTTEDRRLMTEMMREVILPEIEKEVNEGKNFANLRQIYNSLILATWFKRKLEGHLLNRIYVDQNKTEGVDVEDKQVKQKIYEQYLEAFKVGVYNYIKEEYDPATQEVIPRKYFSGGAKMAVDEAMLVVDAPEFAARVEQNFNHAIIASAVLDAKGRDGESVTDVTRLLGPSLTDNAMLSEEMAGLIETAPQVRALQGRWGFTDTDKEQIMAWGDTGKEDRLPTPALIHKIFFHITKLYTSGKKRYAQAWINALSHKWQITSDIIFNVMQWLNKEGINLSAVSDAVFADFIDTTIDTYQRYSNLREKYVYFLPPGIDDNQKLILPTSNMKRMTGMFSPEFINGQAILKATIPGTSYFIAMKYGLAENTHGIYLVIGEEGDSVDPMKGVFARIGLDTQEDTIRVNLVHGVSGKQKLINEIFPQDLGLHPIVALLYIAAELAHQGHYRFENGGLEGKIEPFTSLMGIRPDFIPTMRNGEPTINVLANYERFGLRRSAEFGRWQYVDHIIRNTIPERIEMRLRPNATMAQRRRSVSIEKMIDAFNRMEQVPISSPIDGDLDRAMIADEHVRTGMVSDTLRARPNKDYTDVNRVKRAVALADGVGDHKYSGVASRLAVEVSLDQLKVDILAQVRTRGELKPIWEDLVQKIQAAYAEYKMVNSLTDQKEDKLETTLSLFHIREETVSGKRQVIFFNKGDSRIYAWSKRKRQLIQLTQDDTFAQEFIRTGSMTEEQAIGHMYSAILSDGIGLERGHELQDWQYGIVDIELDDIVFSVSDGIYENFTKSKKEFEDSVAQFADQFEDMNDFSRAIRNQAAAHAKDKQRENRFRKIDDMSVAAMKIAAQADTAMVGEETVQFYQFKVSDNYDLREQALVALRQAGKKLTLKLEESGQFKRYPTDHSQWTNRGYLDARMDDLYRNAIDAIFAQHGSNARQLGQITIQAAVRDQQILIQVIDNGTGISPEILERLGKEQVVTPKIPSEDTPFWGRSGLDVISLSWAFQDVGWTLKFENRRDNHGAIVSIIIPNSPADNKPDRAMMGAKEKDKVGGIDLNPDMLDIEERGRAIEFNLPEELKKLETMPINGFAPIIYQIIPVTNLPLLLGITDQEEPEPLAEHSASSLELSKAYERKEPIGIRE